MHPESVAPGPPSGPESEPCPAPPPVETSAPAPDPVAAPTAEPPPLPPPAAQAYRRGHPFLFHGNEREYFRIWIVNTLLTLLTLGVFAAWAKVRKRRYLRGNTELMGHRFDYLAEPGRILVGNILVVLAFLAYAVIGEVYPAVRLGALLAGAALLPWVIIRSLAFNAHNTRYRGLRFYFRQTYGMAALVYGGQLLVVLLTAGLYYPAWIRNRREFTIGSHRLGDAFFRFNAPVGPFYSAYLLAGGLLLLAAFTGGVLSILLTLATGPGYPGPLQMIPFFALYGLAFFIGKHVIYARLFNHIWNHTRLDNHRFVASLHTSTWLKLQLTNLAAIVGTAGLLYPWAQIRSARLALSHLRFYPAGPLERTGELGRAEGNALGETASEFVGLDFGL